MAMLARRRNGTPDGQGPEPLPLRDVGQAEDAGATEADGQEAQNEERGQSGPANGSPADARGLELIGQEVAVLQNMDASRTPAAKGSEGTMMPRRLWSTAAASQDPPHGAEDRRCPGGLWATLHAGAAGVPGEVG